MTDPLLPDQAVASRAFHVGDVLTITSGGTLLSPRGMEGVYDILRFMCGEPIWTHQIPRVGRECQPELLRQHPQLADVSAAGVNPETFPTWMAEQIARFGETLQVTPLPEHAHESIDPESELAEKVHPRRIIVL